MVVPHPFFRPHPAHAVTAEEVRWYRALLGLRTPDNPDAPVPAPLLLGLVWGALRNDTLDGPATVGSLDTLVIGPLAPDEPFSIDTVVVRLTDRQAKVQVSVRANHRLILRGTAVLHRPAAA